MRYLDDYVGPASMLQEVHIWILGSYRLMTMLPTGACMPQPSSDNLSVRVLESFL